MVPVPAGTFWRGCNGAVDAWCDPDECAVMDEGANPGCTLDEMWPVGSKRATSA